MKFDGIMEWAEDRSFVAFRGDLGNLGFCLGEGDEKRTLEEAGEAPSIVMDAEAAAEAAMEAGETKGGGDMVFFWVSA